MYRFCNDYSEGACPAIMQALMDSNDQQSIGYGEDAYCAKAKQVIHKVLHNESCDIHFLVGGTQTNATVISSALRPFEAVIAADSGHINVHETGAIEATGHKVVIAKAIDGKLYADSIRQAVSIHEDEHMVKPAMVYISNATEIGTIYHKSELRELHEVCKELNLYLFMDGARLGSALCAHDNDVQFADLCEYCDVFYIGGTKNGALFGEAVIIVNDDLKKDFRYMIKQKGAMLAKGRLLGIQFLTLFENDRYLTLAKHANEQAMKMQKAIADCGFSFFTKTTTNQLFPILPTSLIRRLEKYYAFETWQTIDATHTAVRFVTSWATPEAEVLNFIRDFKKSSVNN